MGIISFKWLLLSILFLTNLAAGFSAIRITHYSKNLIHRGQALANGIFIGAAAFQLIPNANTIFFQHGIFFSLLYTLLVTLISFVTLFFIEHLIHLKNRNLYLIMTISLYAFLTGFALGLSTNIILILSIFIAIMAYKAFELFSPKINLHRKLKKRRSLRLFFILFSLLTPLGVFLGMSEVNLIAAHKNNLLIAYLNVISASTFMYIATRHPHHKHLFFQDSYEKYQQILITLLGIFCMGLLII